MVRKELRQDVGAVEAHGADPCQVVQPDLVYIDAFRRDVELGRERALEADRDVAQADGAVAGVEQRSRDDPDRVGEVDDPRVRRRALGDLEHDGDGAHRLGEAPCARRLLTDAAAAKRHRLVAEPRRLAADTDLDEDEGGAVESAVEVRRPHEGAAVFLAREHALRQAADDLEPLRVDVVERELVHRQLRQVRDELGRVGRAGADDGELHPFTPVSVTPSTNARCARKKRTITGAITSSVAAMVRFHCT